MREVCHIISSMQSMNNMDKTIPQIDMDSVVLCKQSFAPINDFCVCRYHNP